MTINDLAFILTLPHHDTFALYDRLAPRYDRLHRRWLRVGGAMSIAAVEGCLAADLHPNVRVLDAGCGTGALGRWILQHEPEARLTMVDAAPGMLDHAGAIAGRTVNASITALPFADGIFDVVICTWVLETLPNPEAALDELQRVLAPGGLLCCCFCSAPDGLGVRLRSWWIRFAITRFFGGRFIATNTLAGLGGSMRRIRYHRGLSTFVCYRKSGISTRSVALVEDAS